MGTPLSSAARRGEQINLQSRKGGEVNTAGDILQHRNQLEPTWVCVNVHDTPLKTRAGIVDAT